ncbi:MAG: hypothetical protein HC908_02145 [Calothrix sp. SM1_7_51]|nr:hypothetical protein [Calothrix sp. SM1_7_51]
MTEKDLEDALNKVKTPIYNLQFLQTQSDVAEFLKQETLEIKRDLDAIFKRTVNALVEERISQESFQVFRVIWQVAADDVMQDSNLLF